MLSCTTDSLNCLLCRRVVHARNPKSRAGKAASGGFPNLGVPCLGIPIMRTIVPWVSYRGTLILWKLPSIKSHLCTLLNVIVLLGTYLGP